jgi:5'-3' exonuclease
MANYIPDIEPPSYLIDASIYIFQAHFSPHIECYDKQGEDLSALYGFSQFLIQFLRREKPKVIAVAMDNSLFCGFRHKLCENYKSNRELPDENLARQLAACDKLCEIMGLARFSSRKYEADDIIGTLARRLRDQSTSASELPTRIGIVTRDKDLAQILANEEEFVWDYQNNRRRFSGDIYQDMGVHPAQIPDYLGLVGDAVDSIAGVPGVGPVKGRHLLNEFENLDEIYSNIESIAGLSLRGAAKLGQLLNEHKEQAYLCKQLATIVNDVEDSGEDFSVASLSSLSRSKADPERLASFLADEKFDERFSDSMVKVLERLNASIV